jgi:hypothetical protein
LMRAALAFFSDLILPSATAALFFIWSWMVVVITARALFQMVYKKTVVALLVFSALVAFH